MGNNYELQANNILPASRGSTVLVNCTTVPQVIDLAQFPQHACSPPLNPDSKNPISKMIRVAAFGGTIWYATGNNFSQLSTLSATAYSTINATTGVVTPSNNEAWPIAPGVWEDVCAVPGVTPQVKNPPGSDSPARYLAIFATANTNIVAAVRQSSW